jgi:hypothetical protein
MVYLVKINMAREQEKSSSTQTSSRSCANRYRLTYGAAED